LDKDNNSSRSALYQDPKAKPSIFLRLFRQRDTPEWIFPTRHPIPLGSVLAPSNRYIQVC